MERRTPVGGDSSRLEASAPKVAARSSLSRRRRGRTGPNSGQLQIRAPLSRPPSPRGTRRRRSKKGSNGHQLRVRSSYDRLRRPSAEPVAARSGCCEDERRITRASACEGERTRSCAVGGVRSTAARAAGRRTPTSLDRVGAEPKYDQSPARESSAVAPRAPVAAAASSMTRARSRSGSSRATVREHPVCPSTGGFRAAWHVAHVLTTRPSRRRRRISHGHARLTFATAGRRPRVRTVREARAPVEEEAGSSGGTFLERGTASLSARCGRWREDVEAAVLVGVEEGDSPSPWSRTWRGQPDAAVDVLEWVPSRFR